MNTYVDTVLDRLTDGILMLQVVPPPLKPYLLPLLCIGSVKYNRESCLIHLSYHPFGQAYNRFIFSGTMVAYISIDVKTPITFQHLGGTNMHYQTPMNQGFLVSSDRC